MFSSTYASSNTSSVGVHSWMVFIPHDISRYTPIGRLRRVMKTKRPCPAPAQTAPPHGQTCRHWNVLLRRIRWPLDVKSLKSTSISNKEMSNATMVMYHGHRIEGRGLSVVSGIRSVMENCTGRFTTIVEIRRALALTLRDPSPPHPPPPTRTLPHINAVPAVRCF